MAGNLHIHGSRMDFAQTGAIRADCPDAIHLVPGSFMAKHYQRGVGRRELHMVQPVGAAMDGVVLSRLDSDCIEGDRNVLGKASFHHLALARRIVVVIEWFLLWLWRGRRWWGSKW